MGARVRFDRSVRMVLVLGIGVLPVALSGCVALVGAGAGAGTVAYVENGGVTNYYAYYPVGIDQASAASKATMQQMGMTYQGAIRKGLGRETIEGITKDGKDVKITLDSPSTSVTKVNIRVGLLGDKPVSMEFHKLLQERLGQSTTTAPASPPQAAPAAPGGDTTMPLGSSGE